MRARTNALCACWDFQVLFPDGVFCFCKGMGFPQDVDEHGQSGKVIGSVDVEPTN